MYRRVFVYVYRRGFVCVYVCVCVGVRVNYLLMTGRELLHSVIFPLAWLIRVVYVNMHIDLEPKPR